MSWHVLTRVGMADTYEPTLGDEPRFFVAIQRPGDPDTLGPDPVAEIAKALGKAPPTVARDLVNIASAAFAADLKIPRDAGTKERWTRDIVLHAPVTGVEQWAEPRRILTELLTFLTGDRWHIELREASSQQTQVVPSSKGKSVDAQRVCLFSGGLDSLVGAIDLLSTGEPVVLVGHYGQGLTSPVQERVLAALRKPYPNSLHEVMLYVQPVKHKNAGEPSMRSRSILFLALGAAVTSALGSNAHLTVAENGLISLNVPLTGPRLGSLSTRTTHPYAIELFRQLLSALGLEHPVDLPYRFQSKGEMLKNSQNRPLLDAVAPLTMSCSHPEIGRYLGKTPGKHCGYCVPCIIRRAALTAAGMPPGEYDFDIASNAIDHTTERGRDLRAYETAIERVRGARPHALLAAVNATGPLPPSDAARYADTYRRGMNEVASVLGLGPVV